jgi:Eco57I restriction-modification methylase
VEITRPTYPLASRRARRWTFSPVNAKELMAALQGLPGTRAVRVDAPHIEESSVVGGVEVARAAPVHERQLRSSWRERWGGGPDPLLVLADDPDRDGVVRALGPLNAGGPLRVVGAQQLLRVLERLPSRPPLQAVRELAEELERLDRLGVGGLAVRGLGTLHLYTTRLRTPERWMGLEAATVGVGGEWREVLVGLGYEVEQQPQRNWMVRYEGRPVALVRPLADAAAFARLDPDGRPPEGVLVDDCLRAGTPYGFLAAGGRLRLMEAAPATGSAVTNYLELDIGALAPEDRPLIGLFAPAMLADGGFAALMEEARTFGTRLRLRLDRAIRQELLPALALGLGRWAHAVGVDVTDDEEREALEAASLTFVFRLLFLMYAESAGYLPVAQEAYKPHSVTRLVQEATDQLATPDTRSTALWDRIGLLVKAMRSANRAWGVSAYNGALFAADGFEGADVLERVALTDAETARLLVALGVDPETGGGVDFSGLDVGHLGHLYEGLLSLRLSVADKSFAYDAKRDRYVAVPVSDAEVRAGQLLWLTDEGGRKGGGVYYTPEALVRHLVRRSVVPAFERHLATLDGLDPDSAGERLFAFRVLDPACGSAHFLVAVVDELADLIARHLGRAPLPAVRRVLDELRAGAGETHGAGIDDVVLLRRLVLKRCVYGVDRSPMGAEIAKVSLWLASFVPGLALSYLDHNVQVGDSLVGVAGADQLVEPGQPAGWIGMASEEVRTAVAAGAVAAATLMAVPDRTPDEVAQSKSTDRAGQDVVAGARRLLDLWVAEPLGVKGARSQLWAAPRDVVQGASPELVARAAVAARQARALHWPLAFPEVFAGEAGGFDAVVGNPPWEEVTVERHAFFARYRPGLRALAQAPREEAIAALLAERPELGERFAAEQGQSEDLRAFFAADSGYDAAPGDPDLYKFFCQRYRRLLGPGGVLAVVLPRSTFLAKGSAAFRHWLFTETSVERIDLLTNSGRWMFDTHPQYTVALVAARALAPEPEAVIEVAGVAASAAAFDRQSAAPGLRLPMDGLGPDREVPLLPSQAAADLLPRLERGTRFPYGGGRWRCFPVGELHESNDKKLWVDASQGRPLWKGESFDRFLVTGAEARPCPESAAALAKQRKPRPGSDSLVAAELSAAERAAAVVAELVGPRVAFRDVSRATDSRTARAALVPPDIFLTNTAPYLAFVDGDDAQRAGCLGVFNSLPFDWQARRYVEAHMNFFILELLAVPQFRDDAWSALVTAAARLSCPDERFADFAANTGVEVGPLSDTERFALEVEVDAHVCCAWGLTPDDLPVLYADFTPAAVTPEHRDALTARLADLVA